MNHRPGNGLPMNTRFLCKKPFYKKLVLEIFLGSSYSTPIELTNAKRVFQGKTHKMRTSMRLLLQIYRKYQNTHNFCFLYANRPVVLFWTSNHSCQVSSGYSSPFESSHVKIQFKKLLRNVGTRIGLKIKVIVVGGSSVKI